MDDQTSGAPLYSPAIAGCVEEEVLEWYRMTPRERWAESMRLWSTFILLGGRLDPEPDIQSPFYDAQAPRAGVAEVQPGVRALRRGGV
jgi:hypothetical protein